MVGDSGEVQGLRRGARLTIQLTEVVLGVVVSRPISKRLLAPVTKATEQKNCLQEDDFNALLNLNSKLVFSRTLQHD